MIKSLHHHLAPPPAVGAAQPAVTASPSFQAESKGIVKMLGLLHAGVNDMVLAVYRSSERSNRATMLLLGQSVRKLKINHNLLVSVCNATRTVYSGDVNFIGYFG